MKTKQAFENFLMEIHAKGHIGTKKTLIDSFDDWLMKLEIDDFILYADKALDEQQEKIIKFLSYDMDFKDEKQRKAVVKMYIEKNKKL